MLGHLTEQEKLEFEFDWLRWSRDNQLPPEGAWNVWLLLAGRGFGKTRTGAEWVRSHAEIETTNRIALVAPTINAARSVMIEGEAGLLNICPPWNRPEWKSSKGTLTWNNGVQCRIFGAETPSKLRGPEHGLAWGDEPAEWRYYESWTNLEFGMRIGKYPRIVMTGTPKPVAIIKELIADKDTITTTGSTFDNKANLSEKFIKRVVDRYEGTRLGQQELYAKLLKDVPGALWNDNMISVKRLSANDNLPDFVRIVVAVDPPVTSGPDADECGIIVCGIDSRGRGYIIDDYSCQGLSPNGWAQKAIGAYYDHKADRMIAEVNNGGELVETIVRQLDQNISYRAVRASKGKVARAEPIAALYEQGRVCHVGTFATLEEQMCEFTSDFDKAKMGYSPDRVDALVWGLTELMLDAQGAPRIRRL